MAKQNKTEEKTLKKVKKIYLGPTIKKFGLINGQIYEGEHTNIKTAISEIKNLKNLFLTIDEDFPKIKNNFFIKGTKENIIYNEVLKQIGGK